MILLDGGADSFGKGGLRQGNSDAAVGDVAGGAKQLALGQDGQQRVQIGFGVEIERRRLCPRAAENDLGVFREPKRPDSPPFRGIFGFRREPSSGPDMGRASSTGSNTGSWFKA
jgi:hypothetical protein